MTDDQRHRTRRRARPRRRGHFHAIDEPIDLSGYAWRGLARRSAFFWLLALDVFYQFFTRYVLNDSAAWTEEIARYLLIVTASSASSMGGAAQHATSTSSSSTAGCRRRRGARCRRFVDVVRILFFGVRDVPRGDR